MENRKAINKIIFLLVLSVVLTLNQSFAQVTVRYEKDVNKLVKDVLIGPGVSVNNIILRGDTLSSGVFNAAGTNLGIDSGVVITTGSIYEVPQPASIIASSVASETGDGDLNSLLVVGQTKDAASIQFQFEPTSSSIKFKIVFASEEYPEFIGDQFLSNDILGIFLSGPGITGKRNIALIPGTDTPISIKSINENIRTSLYVNNINGTDIVYNGFTKPIEIVADELVPCERYTIKLAIADVDDQAYNSAVFIEAESFKSETPNDAQIVKIFPVGTTIQEKCDSALFRFFRNSADVTNPLTVKYEVAGTATMVDDYDAINVDSIVIPAGQVSADLLIMPVDDNLAEPNEEVTITIISNSVCAPSMAMVEIKDYDTLQITGYQDVDCKGDTIYKLVKTSGGSSMLQYVWTDSLGTIKSMGPILVVSPDSLTMYIISIYDSCINYTTVDTIYVPPLIIATITTLKDTILCPPAVLNLFANSTVAGLDFNWTATTASGQDVGFFNDNTLQNPTYTVPSGFTEIFVTVEVTTEGVCADPVTFVIRTINKGIASKKPALICENGTVQLQAFGGGTYRWRPGTGLSDTTIANPIASEERTYTVTITDTAGCSRDFSIQVLIDTIPVANAGRDRIICERESVTLSAAGSDYDTYEWWPRTSLNKYNIPNPVATPTSTTTYILKAINNACVSYDSVTIYVVEVPEAKLSYSFDSCARVIALNNETIGTDSIFWDFGDGDSSISKNPVHKFDSVGTYTVQLIANRNTDCSDTASVQIVIPEIDINKRKIPNVFTPNGDGKNDTFKITGGNVECFIESISIFNRWGKLMYEVKNQTSWEWDGRIGGEIVPPGVYFYSVKGKGFDDVGSFSVIY